MQGQGRDTRALAWETKRKAKLWKPRWKSRSARWVSSLEGCSRFFLATVEEALSAHASVSVFCLRGAGPARPALLSAGAASASIPGGNATPQGHSGTVTRGCLLSHLRTRHLQRTRHTHTEQQTLAGIFPFPSQPAPCAPTASKATTLE